MEQSGGGGDRVLPNWGAAPLKYCNGSEESSHSMSILKLLVKKHLIFYLFIYYYYAGWQSDIQLYKQQISNIQLYIN